jgi:hypothetical protein
VRFKAPKHPKSFVSLDGADHVLTRRADAVYVAEVLAAWASRYLPALAEAEVSGRPAGGEALVAETRAGAISTGGPGRPARAAGGRADELRRRRHRTRSL